MQKPNLQDLFLNEARRKNVPLTVFLVNGFQMRGTVRSFDSFTVALLSEGKEQLIYKHAISTVSPARRLELSLDESSAEGRTADIGG